MNLYKSLLLAVVALIIVELISSAIMRVRTIRAALVLSKIF